MKLFYFLFLMFFWAYALDLHEALLLLDVELEAISKQLKVTEQELKGTFEIPQENIVNKTQFEDKYPFIQLKVADQFQQDGGGFASCGYHALKNGMYIAQFLTVQKLEDKKEALKDLQSSKIIETIWKNIIVQKRNGSDGEWLVGEEIEDLAKQQEYSLNNIQSFPRFGVSVIQDVSLVSHIQEKDRILPLLQALHKKNNEFIHIIMLGSMQYDPDVIRQGSGHWVTIVVHKQKNVIQFYGANSAANASLFEKSYVQTLLKVLTSYTPKMLEQQIKLFELLDKQVDALRLYILNFGPPPDKVSIENIIIKDPLFSFNSIITEFIKNIAPFLSDEWKNQITPVQWNNLLASIKKIRMLVMPNYSSETDDFEVVLDLQWLIIILRQQAGLLDNKSLIGLDDKTTIEKLEQQKNKYISQKENYDKQAKHASENDKQFITTQSENLEEKIDLLQTFLAKYEEVKNMALDQKERAISDLEDMKFTAASS